MKRKLVTRLVLTALAVGALFLSSCSLMVSIGTTPDISGKVVDATGVGESFNGANVTLTNISNSKTYTTTVDSSNGWSVNNISNGYYLINVSESSKDYFTPWTSTFHYTGGSVTAPTVAGVYGPDLNPTSSNTNIAFILMWNNTQQLNLYFTGPDMSQYTVGTSATPTKLDFTTPTYSLNDNQGTTFEGIWNAGFGPNGSLSSNGTTTTSGRPLISSSTPDYKAGGSTTRMTLTVNNSSYGPDAIVLYSFPAATATNSFDISGSNLSYNQLQYSETWWEGVGKFYIDAPNGYISQAASGSTSATSTNATLFVVQADSSGVPSLLGAYTVPTDTTLQAVSALRMNIMGSEYQMVPDMQMTVPGFYRSVASTTSNGIVSVRRDSSKQ